MPATDDEEEERLRRRLYAPGATQADIEAYRAHEHLADLGTGAVEPQPDRRRRRGILTLAGGLAAVLAVALFVVTRPAPAPRPSPLPSVGLDVPERARDGFARALDAGRDPGLLGYLDAHPETILARLRGDGRADSTEFTGRGPVTVSLSPTTEQERAGHLTVILVTDQDVGYEWRATRVAAANDRSGPEPSVAVYDGAAPRGAPVAGTVGYGGGVPTRLTLLVPTGTRWSAVVVYTD